VISSDQLTWAFEAMPVDRLERLMRVSSFDEVIARLQDSRVVSFALEMRCKPPRDCVRAEFMLDVTSDTYDAFYNSRNGYRGQYALSAERGRQANRRLLDCLEERLCAFADAQTTEHAPYVRPSLRGEQAKVWFDEHEKGIYDAGSHIAYPWEHANAPLGTRLKVIGGWLRDTDMTEWLDPSKELRAEEIHCKGFS
jgi:hypothetical protein